ncbi:MAG: molybdenum cofactor guanylyltransferase [Anaerolineales bacterium]|nr:molybdenum cofactor guanylyltransferase [Anaerolineales bacterium]
MLTIVVQAGGESRRMGQDKALLPFLGKPLIARVIERLAPIADELFVTTNRPEGYRDLGVPLFADLVPGRGALGGLYTALSAASHPLVAVVACDMPFVNPDLLAYQAERLVQEQADISIPRLGEGLEPFHAVYRRQSCLPHAFDALQAGKWRADAWFERVKVHEIHKDELLRIDPGLLSFHNVNTPEDLQAAIRLAQALGDDQPGG